MTMCSWLFARITVLFSDESHCPDSVLRDYPVNMKEPRRKQTISAGGWLPCCGVTWAPPLSAACQSALDWEASGERGGWRSFTPQRKSGSSAAHLHIGEGGWFCPEFIHSSESGLEGNLEHPHFPSRKADWDGQWCL